MAFLSKINFFDYVRFFCSGFIREYVENVKKMKYLLQDTQIRKYQNEYVNMMTFSWFRYKQINEMNKYKCPSNLLKYVI